MSDIILLLIQKYGNTMSKTISFTLQSVDIVQMMLCNIIGSRDLSMCIPIFVLQNCEMIDVLFK